MQAPAGLGTHLGPLTSDEWLTIVTQCSYYIDNFGAVDAYVNEGVAKIMGEYGKWVSKG